MHPVLVFKAIKDHSTLEKEQLKENIKRQKSPQTLMPMMSDETTTVKCKCRQIRKRKQGKGHTGSG